MKKIYIKPQVEAASIGVCQMVCESFQYGSETTGANSITEADARRRGWDEDIVEDGSAYGDLW